MLNACLAADQTIFVFDDFFFHYVSDKRSVIILVEVHLASENRDVVITAQYCCNSTCTTQSVNCFPFLFPFSAVAEVGLDFFFDQLCN